VDETTVACTLETGMMQDRRSEWEQLLRATLTHREAIPGGVRIVLRRHQGVVNEVTRLIQLEQDCCRWIDWEIGGQRFVEVKASAARDQGAQVLREWFGVAHEEAAANDGQ
jgi:hypothetical protein